jgi:hypothetical protein
MSGQHRTVVIVGSWAGSSASFRRDVNSAHGFEVSMRWFSALLLLLTVSAHAQVVEESSRPLGNEFREVERSQKLPPGSFEGIGHFLFVYYKDLKLCQCSASEVFVSPSGRFAVFANSETGQVMLLATSTKVVKPVAPPAETFVKAVAWDESSLTAIVRFRIPEDAERAPPALTVLLSPSD